MRSIHVALAHQVVRLELGARMELLGLEEASGTGSEGPPAGYSWTPRGEELLRAVRRGQLASLAGRWRRHRGAVPLLEASEATVPGPRLFVERVTSGTAQVSWEVLEPVAEGSWEVCVLSYGRPQGVTRLKGGHEVREHRVQRLQAQRSSPWPMLYSLYAQHVIIIYYIAHV